MASARGKGRKRGKGRESEIVKKKRIFKSTRKKIKFWDGRCVVKLYSINDKVASEMIKLIFFF